MIVFMVMLMVVVVAMIIGIASKGHHHQLREGRAHSAVLSSKQENTAYKLTSTGRGRAALKKIRENATTTTRQQRSSKPTTPGSDSDLFIQCCTIIIMMMMHGINAA